MTSLVIDASVTAAWCFEDEETKYARDVLKRAKTLSFSVPAIWPLEMANLLLVNERRKRITAADTTRVTLLFKQLEIQVDQPATMQAFDSTLLLARAYGLSSYDASYLELALRQGVPLATLDGRMQSAARAAGVQLFV